MTSFDLFDDQRSHLPKGVLRSFRLPKVTLPGGGYISKGDDGRIAVAGRESLRILRISGSQTEPKPISSTRNLWDGSGLKIDCVSTDVAWAYGVFNNKILTSARNGELIIWDIAKDSRSKFERRTREHLRSIHTINVSRIVHHYCMTGSADGDFRVWDLRDIQASVMRVHNPSAVRRVIFSPCVWNPLFVLVGMDNGTLHRWDLKMGQRGLLDRLPVAHTAPITTIDWASGRAEESSTAHAISFSGHHQVPEHYTGNTLGWVASAGLDRCIKVWDLTRPEAASRMPNRPTYTLCPSYPIRRVLWRPGFECELAVVSHADFTVSSHHVDHLYPCSPSTGGKGLSSGLQSRVESSICLDPAVRSLNDHKLMQKELKSSSISLSEPVLDAVEIWDVRRSWLPKWSVSGTSVEGGVTDVEFADPYTLLAQNTNGTFTQLDMCDVTKPLDAISRTSITWTPNNALAFIVDNAPRWEIPYDDIHPTKLNHEIISLIEPSVIKHIGDRSFRPKTQMFGVFSSLQIQSDADLFVMLAKSYMIDGNDASSSCTKNAEAALAAGKPHIAQIWMLMSTLFEAPTPPQPTTMAKSPPATLQDSPSKRIPRVASLGNITAPAVVRHQHQIQQQKRTHSPYAQIQAHRKSTPPPTATHTPISTQSSIPYTLPSSRNASTPISAGAGANTSRSPDTSRAPRPSPSYHFTSPFHSSSPRLRGTATSSVGHRSPSVSKSKRPTPASSNGSSPLHLSTTLPPVVSNSNVVVSVPAARRTSGLALSLRRESIDSGVADSSIMTMPGASATTRKLVSMSLSSTRQSISVHTSGRQHQQQREYHGRASPSEKNSLVAASANIKHVGEGVLSDSDSDEEGEGKPDTDDEHGNDHEEDVEHEEETNVVDHGNGGGAKESSLSTNNDEILSSSAADIGMIIPSPLFPRISQKETDRTKRSWMTAPEEIDGEAYHDHSSNSPSSESTASQRDGNIEEDGIIQRPFTAISLTNQGTSFKRGMSMRQRSHSSTLASLSAGHTAARIQAQMQVPSLSLKHGSQSSTKTITTLEANGGGGGTIEQSPARGGRDSYPRAMTTSTSRHRDTGKQRRPNDHDYDHRLHLQEIAKAKAEKVTKRQMEIAQAQEERMKNHVWQVVKKAFEELLVIGDVQTAAMMAVIAPEGLGLSVKRRLHILETYVDQLLRCQLYTCAAYFRKHSQVQQIKNITLLDTMIYTLCGRCKKPLIKPVGYSLENPWKQPTFNYCFGCKAAASRCAICRLPVQKMLFQCSICHHGGHHSCYRQFYMNEAMVDVPPIMRDRYYPKRSASRMPLQDFPSNDPPTGTGVESQFVGRTGFAGHPCAAGCGHYCWL